MEDKNDDQYRYCVIGHPVAHSRSPQMQNAAFEFWGMGSPYRGVAVLPAELEDFCLRARTRLDGFNVTVPHKTAILPFLDDVSKQARLSGSVNTVIVRENELIGESTDGYGLECALRENFDVESENRHFLFIGSGGAARAGAFHLAERGAGAIFFANRSPEKAEELASAVHDAFDTVTTACALADEERLKEFADAADVLIQATPLGLKSEDPMPFAPELLDVKNSLAVFDMIYLLTPVLKEALKRGMKAADGRDMLVHQGARSFELWTGKTAPVDLMLHAIENRDETEA